MNNNNNTAGVAASARRVILLCFFLTGMSGIIYEIVWVRQFTLVFGNTVYAVGAVLAAFMAGLGIGGYVFGIRVEKSGNPVLYYGLLELFVGVYALLMPFLIRALEGASPSLLSALHDSRAALFFFKFAASFVMLFLPTFCMGASLPLMTSFFVKRRAVFGNVVSFLYALNTMGAVVGVFLATFAMLPYAGVSQTILMAFTVNAGVGLLAILQHFKLKAVKEDAAPEGEVSAPPAGRGHPGALLVVLLSGFMAMALEVAWTRTIALLIGSSIYSFSLILLTFLLGITIGGFICSRYYRKGRTGGFGALAFCQMATVVSAAAALPALTLVTMYIAVVVPKLAVHPTMLFASNFAVCVFVLLVPAIFLGVSFPMAAEIYADKAERSARTVGKVYLFNTFGTIAGSILAGFVLIPAIGVRSTLIVALASGIASGLAALAFASGVPVMKRALWAVVPVAVTVAVAASPFWKKEIMTSGSFLYGLHSTGPRVKNTIVGELNARAGEILYYHDGAVATVSVHKVGEHLFLRVNGKTDASTGADMHTQVLSAYMPMLLMPGAKDALVIGIGSGTTAGRILQFPVKKVRCVEIERGVAIGSRHFSRINGEYWKDPRNEIIFEDARNFLLLDKHKYDVIVSEPSNPWMAGVASLYTNEAFSRIRDHLKPGGIACQWLQKYRISEYDLGIALTTFADVFPHVLIFRGVQDDLLLLGSKSPFYLHHRDIQAYLDTLPQVQKGLDELGVSNALSLLVSSYVSDKQFVSESFRHVSLRQTDDTPYLEFFAPLDMFAVSYDFFGKHYWDTLGEIPAIFGASEKDFTRETRMSLAEQFEKRFSNKREAEKVYLRILEQNPNDKEAVLRLASLAVKQGTLIMAEKLYRRAIELDPEDRQARKLLLEIYARQKMNDEAMGQIDALLRLNTRDADAKMFLGNLLLGERKYKPAYLAFSEVFGLLAPEEKRPRSLALLGMAECAKNLGDRDMAIKRLKESLEEFPASFMATVNLAQLLIEKGDYENALQYLNRAVGLSRPEDEPFLKHLLMQLPREWQR